MDVDAPLSHNERICSAQVSGVAGAYAVVRRLTRQEALDELAEVLAALEPRRRVAVLANAAAARVQTGYRDDRDRAAAELLEEAGADLDEARAVWLRRFPSGSPPRDWPA